MRFGRIADCRRFCRVNELGSGRTGEKTPVNDSREDVPAEPSLFHKVYL